MNGSGSHIDEYESRVGRPKTAASLAGMGLLAAIGIVCAAVALRDPDAVAVTERPAPQPPQPAPTASAQSQPSAAPTAEKPAPEASAPPAKEKEEKEEEKPVPARATEAELASAQAAGSDALGALAQRYPDDPAVLRAVAIAQGREKAFATALLTAKRLFELAPEETANDELRHLILRAANAAPEVAVTALDLMAKHMGSRGPDLLYEVVTGPRFGDYPKDSASRLLLDSSVRQLASPALLVADDLRRVAECPSKPLIARAREEGDARALHYIKYLLTPYRCPTNRKRNCLRCKNLHKELRAAAAAIEKRRKEKQENAASAKP